MNVEGFGYGGRVGGEVDGVELRGKKGVLACIFFPI